jgi:hypothetical protein
MDNDSLQAMHSQPPDAVPGMRDSTVLLLDALMNLLGLARAEALQAARAVPQLLVVNLYRLPILLLAWISFCVLIACSIYALTESTIYSAGSFFMLQLTLMVLLEQGYRRLHARIEFRETRKGLVALRAGLKDRLERELC